MKYGPADHERIESLPFDDHHDDLICQCKIVSDLAHSDKDFLTRHYVQQYQDSHYDGKIESAGPVDTVEEKGTKYHDRIDPDPDIRRDIMFKMKRPADNKSCNYKEQNPDFPSHKEGFRYKYRGKDRITD